MGSGMSHSYSTQRDKNLSKLAGFAISNPRYDDRILGASTALPNQVTCLETLFSFDCCKALIYTDLIDLPFLLTGYHYSAFRSNFLPE